MAISKGASLTLKRSSSSSWECFSVNGSERYAPIAAVATEHVSVLGEVNWGAKSLN